MLPTAFLSLSGVDSGFVSRVEALLPDALAHFYSRTFENGESLLSAMEERLGRSTIFVLFASQASLKSVWVKFEIDRARLAKVKNPNVRVLVFSIDPTVTYEQLPSWMQENWVSLAGRSARDIARYIRNVLINVLVSESPLSEPIGRGSFIDDAIGALQQRYLDTREMPNVFVFGGHTGIGRQTVKRKFLSQAFVATRELNFGPEFLLPQFADSADLYRSLRQEIDPQFSQDSFERDLLAFNNLSSEEKAQELARHVEYFGQLGQAVTLVTGNGIYEDRGIVKPWVVDLFQALTGNSRAKLCIISNRLLHQNELTPHPNVLQFSVPGLSSDHIKTLMIATAQAMKFEPQLPNDKVIQAIGGHAGIARTTAGLIAQIGVVAVNDNMSDLFRLQDEVLRESLGFDRLSPVERDILSILSWVPQLNGQLVRDVIVERHKISTETFAETVSRLACVCLLSPAGANYLISSPIRSMFRRLHGYGSPELQKELAARLEQEWTRNRETDEFPTELFDAFVYMIALEGGSLPKELKKLLLPSTLQEVVKETYDTGHDDDDAMRRAVTWGIPAKEIIMDETTREEILSYVVRAQTRLQDYPGAKATLQFMDSKGYRSRFYLRSFFTRLSGGNLNEAVSLLQKAKDVRKYRRRVVADLAGCYHKLGKWRELAILINEEGDVDNNAVLLDFKIGMLLAKSEFPSALDNIRKLRSSPWDEGRSESRTAMLLMKRDHDFSGAMGLLTDLLKKNTRGQSAVRKLRAIAAAEGGFFDVAAQDIEFLKLRQGGGDAALRIEARILNRRGQYAAAEEKLNILKSSTVHDELLRARILDNRAADIQTPLAERATLHERVREIRTRYPTVNEFDVD